MSRGAHVRIELESALPVPRARIANYIWWLRSESGCIFVSPPLLGRAVEAIIFNATDQDALAIGRAQGA